MSNSIQSLEYVMHLTEAFLFINDSCRLLGYSSEMNTSGALTVSVDGREVAITCIHVGVDLPRVQQALDSK
jgi:prophage antirepressor-like protein